MQNIKIIPYGRQLISGDDVDAVGEVLRSDFLTQGPIVPKFEEAVSEYVGAKFGVAVNSSTSGLHIACLSLGVGPGDVVWTAANTFVASANAALYCGAKVDFIDIDSDTYNLSIPTLELKLIKAKKAGALPKVVIPVHFSGQPCNMEEIGRLGKEYGFRIIEDASHAIGATYQDSRIGSCRYSDITVFSFHPVKIITTGEGGMVLTNDPELYLSLKLYRSHGITSDEELMDSRPNDEIWNYQQISLGFNYRMTDIAAALGLSQLSKLDEFLKRRRQIADRYLDLLSDIPIKLPWQLPRTGSSYHLYVIQIELGRVEKTQKQIYRELQKQGINVNIHYIPVYRQPYYERLGFKQGYCPISEEYYKSALSIPIYPGLLDEEQGRVIQAMREIIN
jgi:UDP-4-amino-4,6-dideoxy-N-acetyl-beta-L-altrosamine transaminase